MEKLSGKTIIVTGASRGIGRALSIELARAGVNLVLNARHAAPLDEVASSCGELGVDVRSAVGNSAEESVASRLVQLALGIGNFHGFIHAAGVLYPGPFLWELTESEFREVYEASVIAGHRLIRHALPELIKRGGGIAVFFGSGAAERHMPGIGAYSSAKAAEEHLARQVAAEAPEITSFVYRPGVVETRMQEQARSAEGGAADRVRSVFKSYKEQGELISPEQAARSLLRILADNPRRFHGKIARWSDAP